MTRRLLFLASLLTASPALAQYALRAATVTGGGAVLSGGPFTAVVAAGEPALGGGAGEAWSVGSGVWAVVEGVTYTRNAVALEPGEAPAAFRLHAPFPNPASASATVRYDLPAPADLAVVLYDVLGRAVRRVEVAAQPAGSGHDLRLDLSALASGLYLVRLSARLGGEPVVGVRSLVVAR